MKLKHIFEVASKGQLQNDFLYLPADESWTLESEGEFIVWTDDDLEAEEDLPRKAKELNLMEALDGQTIESIVEWADRLSGTHDNEARLEVFFYYYDHDAFPEKLGGPPPPPVDEILRRLDREFYDKLGDENPEKKCRCEDCNRGAVQFSVFCRVHHFENIKKKPCPYSD